MLTSPYVQDLEAIPFIDPIDALPPLGILLDNGFSPESAHDIVDRHHLLGGEGLEFRVSVTLQQIER
jgi:hypothetical protein